MLSGQWDSTRQYQSSHQRRNDLKWRWQWQRWQVTEISFNRYQQKICNLILIFLNENFKKIVLNSILMFKFSLKWIWTPISYLRVKGRTWSVVIVKECLTTPIVRATAARGNGRPKSRGALLALLTMATRTIVVNSFHDALISLIHPRSWPIPRVCENIYQMQSPQFGQISIQLGTTFLASSLVDVHQAFWENIRLFYDSCRVCIYLICEILYTTRRHYVAI
jgi:hypothetical protein